MTFFFGNNKKEETRVLISDFEQAWQCKCGYITHEGRTANTPATRFCNNCGYPTEYGSLYIGKWTYIRKYPNAKPESLWYNAKTRLTFDIYVEYIGKEWYSCHGTYPLYERP